MIRFTSVCD